MRRPIYTERQPGLCCSSPSCTYRVGQKSDTSRTLHYIVREVSLFGPPCICKCKPTNQSYTQKKKQVFKDFEQLKNLWGFGGIFGAALRFPLLQLFINRVIVYIFPVRSQCILSIIWHKFMAFPKYLLFFQTNQSVVELAKFRVSNIENEYNLTSKLEVYVDARKKNKNYPRDHFPILNNEQVNTDIRKYILIIQEAQLPQKNRAKRYVSKFVLFYELWELERFKQQK